jgi:kynurenine formamidase
VKVKADMDAKPDAPLSERLAAARVIDLEQPRFAGMPTHPAHKPAYFYGLYRRHRDNYRPDTDGPRSGSSGVLTMMEHSGTHIDALCHQARDLRLFGDVAVDDIETTTGFRELGIETVPPLLGRGVLLDVASWKKVDRLPPAYSVSDRELDECARSEGVHLHPGDVLLVRTGYGAAWTDEPTYMSAAGVGKSGTIWAAERRVVAVGADNLVWDQIDERDPDTNSTLFAHLHLLQRHGIYIMENLNLEALAAAKAYTFAFVGIPLKLRGATGSPIRPLALI